ncbi:MAG: FAD-dependent oxidoreductase [Gammaproteobacteria bacterium]|nr:FAD-dependent oxidoreductase [Gammaproteobacteria bacterium]
MQAAARKKSLDRLKSGPHDVLIIGGGINGAASAAALAAHGAKVALADSRDFAGFTSQQSSNLVWGGIKYMESYEFGLVAELCRSRNELLDSFPSAIKEIRFLTTVAQGFRFHPLSLWAGAWLYWLMGRGKTRIPRYHTLSGLAAREPLIDTASAVGGVEYSDAYLPDNDARFVFNFVRSAVDRGAATVNYVQCTGAERRDGRWQVAFTDRCSGDSFKVGARVLVNAAGAYVDEVNALAGVNTAHRHVLSKGVHLLVPRLSAVERVLAFFADDGRLFFAIPMAHRTCIGTTDTPVFEVDTRVEEGDREFVLSNINARLKLPRPLTAKDVLAERCGVRPLAVKEQDNDAHAGGGRADFLALSRKHVIETQAGQSHISIFGGKLTDCLNVGAEICAAAAELGIAMTPPARRWYGEPEVAQRRVFEERARALGLDGDRAQDSGESLMTRLWRRYGGRAPIILDALESEPSLAAPAVPGTGLRVCEVDYMAEFEMVVSLDDLLRRRSKLELVVGREALLRSGALPAISERLFGCDGRRRLEEYARYPLSNT